MLELGDVDYIKGCIESVGEYTEEIITLYTISASSGTGPSMEPKSVTWVSTDIKANVQRLSAREINESGGIYEADDLAVHSIGSYNKEAKIGWRTGTYNVIEKPAPTTIADNDVRFRAVVRRG